MHPNAHGPRTLSDRPWVYSHLLLPPPLSLIWLGHLRGVALGGRHARSARAALLNSRRAPKGVLLPAASFARLDASTVGRPVRRGSCARVVAGRYYKGQQISTTLLRFLDSCRSCRPTTAPSVQELDECGADLLPFFSTALRLALQRSRDALASRRRIRPNHGHSERRATARPHRRNARRPKYMPSTAVTSYIYIYVYIYIYIVYIYIFTAQPRRGWTPNR